MSLCESDAVETQTRLTHSIKCIDAFATGDKIVNMGVGNSSFTAYIATLAGAEA